MMGRPQWETSPVVIDFNRRHSKAGRIRRKLPALLIVAGCAAAVLLFATHASLVWQESEQTEAELQVMEQQIAKVRQDQSSSRIPVLEGLIKSQQQLLLMKPDSVGLLQALTKLIPDECNLTSVSVEQGTAVTLNVLFADTAKVSAFLRAVQASDEFSVTQLGRLDKIGATNPLPAGAAEQADIVLPLRATVELSYNAAAKGENPS